MPECGRCHKVYPTSLGMFQSRYTKAWFCSNVSACDARVRQIREGEAKAAIAAYDMARGARGGRGRP